MRWDSLRDWKWCDECDCYHGKRKHRRYQPKVNPDLAFQVLKESAQKDHETLMKLIEQKQGESK
jgi:hypothetical protein